MYIPWMCWIFCPRILREMAILDEEPEDDPLDWELEKIEKLKRLADAYGWDEDHKEYKAKLKGIQALGKARLNAQLGKKQGKTPATGLVWEACGEFKANDFSEARKKLTMVKAGGDWKVDRRCPQSTSGGMVARRFILVDKKEKKAYLARLISLGDKNFRIQRGLVQDLEEEENALDDDPDGGEDDAEEDDGSGAGEPSRRGAAAPKGKGKAAAAAPPEEAPTDGKRRRVARGK